MRCGEAQLQIYPIPRLRTVQPLLDVRGLGGVCVPPQTLTPAKAEIGLRDVFLPSRPVHRLLPAWVDGRLGRK